MAKEQNWYVNYENKEVGYESSTFPPTTEAMLLYNRPEQMPFAAK